MHLFNLTARIALILWLLTLAPARARTSLEPRLSTFWDDWIADVGLLLSNGEKKFFETLQDEERELFVQALWEVRGAEALERWSRNVLAADQLRPRSPAARRAVLLFGKPASIERIESCGGLRALEIWRWEPWHIARQQMTSRPVRTEADLVLVFAQRSRLLPDSFAPWDTITARDLGFYKAEAEVQTYLDWIQPQACVDGTVRAWIAAASSFETLERAMPWPTPPEAWYGDLLTRADLFGTPQRQALLEITYAGTNGRQTILHAVLEVRRERLQEIVPGQIFDRVTVVGDIFQRDYLVDSFEVTHHIAGAPPGDVIELDLFRGLRPGRYRLELRAADRDGMTLLRTRRQLDVPTLDFPAPPPPGRQQGYGQLTRGEVVLLDTFPGVEVLPVTSRATPTTDLYAITTGGPIAAVEFYVDDRSVGADESSPYSVEAELTAGRHVVKAVAVDTEGRSLADDARLVEPKDRPFSVYLDRPSTDGLPAPVRLSVPQGAELDRVQCFDGPSLIGTLDNPPYECPAPKRQASGLLYTRVLATLTNGESTEHLLFFGPNAPETIDVELVELFVSVFDSVSRPVTGLAAGEFRVWQGGRQLALDRVESLADLPISVAVLMDLSSSMGRLAHLAAESAERFFENVMIDDDVASLLAFNDDFHQLVAFTGDITELRLGALGIHALGSTRLNDGVVWALSQFAGQENRRALVILSDGVDVNSDFPFAQVVSAAVDAGVVVYPISIVRRGEEPPQHLEELARRTGGTRFIVSSIRELDRAYRRIAQELRSQYLLVYRPDGSSSGFAPGAVDIEVMRPGHTTRNIHGYYQ